MEASNHRKKIVDGATKSINDTLKRSKVRLQTKYKIVPVNRLAKLVCSKWLGWLFKIRVETEVVVE